MCRDFRSSVPSSLMACTGSAARAFCPPPARGSHGAAASPRGTERHAHTAAGAVEDSRVHERHGYGRQEQDGGEVLARQEHERDVPAGNKQPEDEAGSQRRSAGLKAGEANPRQPGLLAEGPSSASITVARLRVTGRSK
jgi:hypothetical protein